MIDLVEKLVEKGFAYEKLRSVYFDISKLHDYGRLSNIDLGQVKHGLTVDLDDYEKDSPGDFTLLKRTTLSELKRGIYFQTRWGNVRPSWHLECASISLGHLGETFDIHSSGNDIIFPHCENVMAIGKAATGKMMANYWLNTELVMADGKKMSRSLSNTVSIENLEQKGFSGKQIRFFLLGLHYRKSLNFSWNALETAKNAVRRINGFIQKIMRSPDGGGCPDIDQLLYGLNKRFNDAMDDDLNISSALAALFEFIKQANPLLVKGLLSAHEKTHVLEMMEGIDSVLGVMNFDPQHLSEEALSLLTTREELRRKADWQGADKLREQLQNMGVEVQDTPEGMTWILK